LASRATADLNPAAHLALDDALGGLEPRQLRVVECRCLGGLTDDEIAWALGVAARTVRRDWGAKARG
jgi:DNA-directed RNA polymerase specialized sigma24 family protein